MQAIKISSCLIQQELSVAVGCYFIFWNLRNQRRCCLSACLGVMYSTCQLHVWGPQLVLLKPCDFWITRPCPCLGVHGFMWPVRRVWQGLLGSPDAVYSPWSPPFRGNTMEIVLWRPLCFSVTAFWAHSEQSRQMMTHASPGWMWPLTFAPPTRAF